MTSNVTFTILQYCVILLTTFGLPILYYSLYKSLTNESPGKLRIIVSIFVCVGSCVNLVLLSTVPRVFANFVVLFEGFNSHFHQFAANKWDLFIFEFMYPCTPNNPKTLYFPYSLLIVWGIFFVVTCYKDIRSKNLQYKPFLTFLLGMLVVFNIAGICILEVAARYQQVLFFNHEGVMMKEKMGRFTQIVSERKPGTPILDNKFHDKLELLCCKEWEEKFDKTLKGPDYSNLPDNIIREFKTDVIRYVCEEWQANCLKNKEDFDCNIVIRRWYFEDQNDAALYPEVPHSGVTGTHRFLNWYKDNYRDDYSPSDRIEDRTYWMGDNVVLFVKGNALVRVDLDDWSYGFFVQKKDRSYIKSIARYVGNKI